MFANSKLARAKLRRPKSGDLLLRGEYLSQKYGNVCLVCIDENTYVVLHSESVLYELGEACSLEDISPYSWCRVVA